MIKNKKSIMIFSSVFLMAAILFGAFIPAFAVGETEEPKIPSLSELDRTLLKEFDMNSYSWLVFQDLMDCFPKNMIPDENMPRYDVAYPAEYAGAFIDEDNRLHIVLTKHVDTETEFDYRAITSYDDSVVFDVAEFPLQFLYDVQKTLDDVMGDFDIRLTGVNECINRLEIRLADKTREQGIVSFLKNRVEGFNDKCLMFSETVGEIQPTYGSASNTALAGEKTTNSGGSGATIGFNAYRLSDNAYGVVTAGHFASVGTTIRNSAGTTIGTTSVSYHANGENIDAAFVPFGSSVSQSDRLFGTFPSSYDDYLTGYTFTASYIVTGLSVDKIGSNTSRTTGGTVRLPTTSIPVNVSNVIWTYKDQVEISNHQKAGDSGGPVYHPINLPINQIRPNVLIGIATFGDLAPDYYGYVSKITNILPKLNVVLHSNNKPSPVFMIKQAVPYGTGSITNANNLVGLRDGQFANIKGTAKMAGGQIIGMPDRLMRCDIWIYARSESGYNTDLYTYAAFDFNGPWTQTMCQTVQSSAGTHWIYCGPYTKNDLAYIGLAAINDNGNQANISIDSVILVPK